MKIGLTLSGGGTRGIGHIGLLKVLEEHNIKISIVSGTSAGALVGAMFANGYSASEILKISKQVKLFDWNTLSIGSLGFLKMQTIEKFVQQYLPKYFENLKLPFYACATDIIHNNEVFFHQGNLHSAVLASAAIPILYEPIQINNTYYVDGGVLNNLPIEPLLNQCDFLIAMHVNHLASNNTKITWKDIVEKSFTLSISQSVYLKKDKVNLFIDPPNMSKFNMFDNKNADEIYQYCYNYAKKLFSENKQLIEILPQ
ncbi:MAG: patatin-like phospholipase family protein [Bacteroidota bacterium]